MHLLSYRDGVYTRGYRLYGVYSKYEPWTVRADMSLFTVRYVELKL
jgi:hypothetical protein